MKTNWSNALKMQNKDMNFLKEAQMKAKSINCDNRQQGFTLIEIMIALLIVSVGVVAVMTATAKSVDIAADLERRTVASWVVSNKISEVLQLSKTESVSARKSTDKTEMGGYEWRVRTVIEETQLERVFRLTVEAYDDNSRQDTAVISMTSSLADKL